MFYMSEANLAAFPPSILFVPGQLYKVNVPVVVTQGAAGSHLFSQTTHKLIEWRDARVPQPAVVIPPVVNTFPSKEVAPPLLPAPPPPPPSHPQPPEPQKTVNPSQETIAIAPQQLQVPLAENLDSQVSQQKQPEMIVDGGDELTQEPDNTGVAESTEFLDLQTESLEMLAQAPAGSVSKDMDDILKEVIEDEINKAAAEVIKLFSCTFLNCRLKKKVSFMSNSCLKSVEYLR